MPSAYGHPANDDELEPDQLAAMQSLDDAYRRGDVSPVDRATIEQVIRLGRVHGARKRLTAAKKDRRRSDGFPPA